MSHILVTGGAGFIGSHIVDELVKRNCDVTVLDHLRKKHESNLEESKDSIRLVKGSVTNRHLVRDNVDVDVIFHEASCDLLTKKPISSLMVNVKGTLNILETMNEKCVLVFGSTGSVYGNPVYVPQDEKHPCHPVSPYGISKHAAEQYINFYAKTYGLKTVILRYYNVIGRRQNFRVVADFVKRVLNGEPPVIEGDGTQKRCFTSVEDIVQANILAYENEKAYGLTFNIASNEITTINKLASLVCSFSDRPITPIHVTSRTGDVQNFEPSIYLAQTILGYSPKHGLKDMVADLMTWMKEVQK